MVGIKWVKRRVNIPNSLNQENCDGNNGAAAEASTSEVSAGPRRSIRFLDIEESLLSENEDEAESTSGGFLSPMVCCNIAGQGVQVLIDSGSQCSAISELFYLKLKNTMHLPVLPVSNTSISLAVGSSKQRIKQQALVTINILGFNFEIPCLIIPNLNKDLLLGCDWLAHNKVEINFHAMVINIPDKNICIPVQFGKFKESEISLNFIQNEESVVRHKYSEAEISQVVGKCQTFDEQEKKELYNLINHYQMVFSETPGLIRGYEHAIKMRDATPFHKANYPIPLKHRPEAQLQIEAMLKLNVIRPSQTEYVSPLTTVVKKDGSIRVCLDARHLNTLMVMDHVIPPRPDELLTKLKRKSISRVWT